MLRLSRRLSWLALLLPLLVHAATGGRDLAVEGRIEDELRKIDPALVEPFRAARIAMDKGDYAETARLLAPVVERAPAFDAATRRLGISLAQTGRQNEGLAYAEKAVALKRSAANLSTLADVLAFPANTKSTRPQQERALALLLECRALPDGRDAGTLASTAQLALQLERRTDARAAIADLEARFPGLMQTHYFAAVMAAIDEHWIKAADEIEKARKLGLDPAQAKRFLDSGVASRATAWRLVRGTLWTLGLWIAGLALLFGVGFALSKATLSQIERSDVSVPISAAEHRLRRIYRSVLNVAGLYYYVSLPVVMILVILVSAALLYGFLMMGFLPIKLLVIVVVGVLATIWTMGRSLFLRVKSTEPGRALTRAEAEGLWKLTDEVAAALHTRPIDEIRITFGTDLCVYERGSWREKLDNRAKRVLVLGAAVLNDFKQEDFRSVLAHEYGHFSNRDTAGGDIALRVQNDMLKFYYAMLAAGQATWLNVAFHFLRAYHFIFRRISHGATRLQEVLADRVAAQTYGPPAFEGGLRHVIRQSIIFDAHAGREIDEAIKQKRPLQNLYAAAPALGTDHAEAFDKAINRPTTEDDTHPGPRDRFRLIAKIPVPGRPASTGAVWELFRDRDAIVREMMESVEKNVAPHRA